MPVERYDLIVIGAGSGGLTAVDFAVKLGARVALVEKHRVGGDCTWTGCVPSKALLHAAGVAQSVRDGRRFGIFGGPLQVDMGRVRDYVQGRIAEIYQHETSEALLRDGIEVLLGAARFLDAHTIEAGGRTLTAPKFIVATGAHPFAPPVPGLEKVDYWTYERIFENDWLPDHLIVLGAGPIGLEIAQAYGRLGSRVTLIDEAVLPGVDEDVSQVLTAVLAADGVEFVPGLATAVSRQGDQLAVQLEDRLVEGKMLFVATGRRPNVRGLDLERAGVHFSEKGIEVDRFLRTSAGHIFAVGDCNGGFQFTHYAGRQAFTAVRNALLPGRETGVRQTVPWAVFTDPEVAQAGLTETAARATYGSQVQVARLDVDRVDRAIIEDAKMGFIKLIHRSNGKLLGVTIVAAHAGEIISEFALALEKGFKIRDLAEVMHIYPTMSMGTQLLAAGQVTRDFLTSPVGRLVRRLAGLGKPAAMPHSTPVKGPGTSRSANRPTS